MADRTRATHADAASERLWTGATVITAVRTIASLVMCLLGLWQEDLTFLVIGLGLYWGGDMLDGAYARVFDCETRTGAVIDMLCDRANCAAFYLSFAALQHEMVLPVAVYLVEFMIVDFYLSLAFLAWPIRSPNYFYEVDERIYRWNWSKPAKAMNSSLFAVLLLVTGWWWLGLGIAIVLLAVKVCSLSWLLDLGMPVPERPTETSRDRAV